MTNLQRSVSTASAWLSHVGAIAAYGLTMQGSCLKSKPNCIAGRHETHWQTSVGTAVFQVFSDRVFVCLFVYCNRHTANPARMRSWRTVRSNGVFRRGRRGDSLSAWPSRCWINIGILSGLPSSRVKFPERSAFVGFCSLKPPHR